MITDYDELIATIQTTIERHLDRTGAVGVAASQLAFEIVEEIPLPDEMLERQIGGPVTIDPPLH